MSRKAGKSIKSRLGHNFVVIGHSFVVFVQVSQEVDQSGPFCKMCKAIIRDRNVMLNTSLGYDIWDLMLNVKFCSAEYDLCFIATMEIFLRTCFDAEVI